jgi:hypothetical protein
MRASSSGALTPVVLSLPLLGYNWPVAWINAGANESKRASELSSEASTALHQLLQKHQAKKTKRLGFCETGARAR